jgi:hypothetical protein
VALTLVAPLTAGSFTFFVVAALPRPVFAVVVFLAAAFPRAAVALETAFLTPALIDLEVRSLRFLPWRDAVLSVSSASFRLVPAVFFAGFEPPAAFFSSAVLRRCSLSFGRGPRMPRHFSDPQRHCWTFLLE